MVKHGPVVFYYFAAWTLKSCLIEDFRDTAVDSDWLSAAVALFDGALPPVLELGALFAEEHVAVGTLEGFWADYELAELADEHGYGLVHL